MASIAGVILASVAGGAAFVVGSQLLVEAEKGAGFIYREIKEAVSKPKHKDVEVSPLSEKDNIRDRLIEGRRRILNEIKSNQSL